MEFDLQIKGGTIVDGTGSPGVRGDLAVRDGRIAAMGEVAGHALRTIDATGRVVCPGFVDIHTHYDAQLFWDRMLSISPWHGVTTVLMGNCGFGIAPTAPAARSVVLRTLEKVEGMSLRALEAGLGDWGFESFPEYLDAIERRGPAINVLAMIGHTPVRLHVMGEDALSRAATDDEIARMRAIVREAMDAGAAGFATSRAPSHVGYEGKPVPSRVATIEEIRALAGAVGDAGRGLIQTAAGPDLFFDEFARLARDTGRTVTWTALLGGLLGPGSHRFMLKRSTEMARSGLSVVPQVSCRPLVFDFDLRQPFAFESLAPFSAIASADARARAESYADPAFRSALRDVLASGRAGIFQFVPDRVWVSASPHHPELVDRTLSDVAAERGGHPVDVMLDLTLESNLDARFRMAAMNDDEDEVAELLTSPDTVLGLSDAGAHANELCDACFSTHLLGHWVREKGTMPLEEGVRMLTSRPADVIGLEDRGRLAPGLAADLVVFDPVTVGASSVRRVNDLPAGADRLVADASGVDAVIVNGTVLREHGRDALDSAGKLPGKLLRGGSSLALALAMLATAACSASSAGKNSPSGQIGGAGGSGAMVGGAGGTAAGGSGNLGGDGGTLSVDSGTMDAMVPTDGCGSVTVPSETDVEPGNVLVVFDQSWTMADPWIDPSGKIASKIVSAGDALIAAVSPIAFKLNVGTIFFPTLAAPGIFDVCPADVAPITQAPQIPIVQAAQFVTLWQQHFGPGWAAVLGTPLHKALHRADEALQNPFGKTAVVIFTDGHWTCGDGSEVPTVASMHSRGIRTYVVGLPGAYGIVGLDGLAQAGGTAAPGCTQNCFLIPTNVAQLQTELEKIATETITIASCTITLNPPPPSLDDVHLVVVDAMGGTYEVPRDDGAGNGWTISPDGSTATLTGTICDDAKAGRFIDVSFEYGCVELPPIPK